MTFGYSSYIYYGDNEVVYDYFSQKLFTVSGVMLEQVTDFQALNRQLYQLIPQRLVILFFQKTADLEDDLRKLDVLNKDYKGLFIFLVGDDLTLEEKKSYLTVGVTNTISKNASIEVFQSFKKYLTLYFEAASQSAFMEQMQNTGTTKVKIPLIKRLFDLAVAAGVILVLSPILLAVYIAIKLESKGPAIYKSKRIGAGYEMFDFYKFRSMYSDADQRLKDYMALNQYAKSATVKSEAIVPDLSAADLENLSEEEAKDLLISDEQVSLETKGEKEKKTAFFKLEKDPRVTKVGRFIRKYSLDELPQLFNVIKGDMSIVGNRPVPLYEAEVLTTDEGIERFMAPAGITGLWQVEKRGDNGSMSDEERIRLDVTYARNYGVKMDLKIILKTFTAFIQKADV